MSTDSTWRQSLAHHEQATVRQGLLGLATSAVPYLLLTVAMYLSLELSVWLTLALAIPAAGFLLRTFIVFHDCAHGSFLPSKRGTAGAGASPRCSSSSRSRTGATTTPSTTAPPATSTGAAPAT